MIILRLHHPYQQRQRPLPHRLVVHVVPWVEAATAAATIGSIWILQAKRLAI